MKPGFGRFAGSPYSRLQRLSSSAFDQQERDRKNTSAWIRSIAISEAEVFNRTPFSYDQCVAVRGVQFQQANELADLRGRVALLTGGRCKDRLSGGPQAAACGSATDRTTRFPAIRLKRYAQEPDFSEWRIAWNLRAGYAASGSVEASAGSCWKRSPARFHQSTMHVRPFAVRRVLRAHDGG